MKLDYDLLGPKATKKRERAKKAARLLPALVMGLLLPTSAWGQTLSIRGSSFGVFLDPDTGVTSGVGTNFFSWGVGLGTAPSQLLFNGATFATTVPKNYVFGSPQRLTDVVSFGTLDYFNGTIEGGTGANSVSLNLGVSISDPTGIAPQSFSIPLQLINSPNTDDPFASADSVFLTPPGGISPVVFHTPDGAPLTLQDIHFGNIDGGGFNTIDQFFVLEGESASAQLLGRFRPPAEQILRGAVSVSSHNAQISGLFTPNFGLSLAQAATQCGYDHFNWYQIVTQDPHPPGGLTAPYVDPPPGGGPAFGPADNLPFYWDETEPSGPGYRLSDHTTLNVLDYFDMPRTPDIQPGEHVDFTTSLAGIRPDGTWDILYVFRWSSNYNGGTGGVTIRRGTGVYTGGTGDISGIQLDLTAADLTTQEKLMLAQAGATNVSVNAHAQGTLHWGVGGTTSALFQLDGSNPQVGLFTMSDPVRRVRFIAGNFKTLFVSDTNVYLQGIGSFGTFWACPFTLQLDLVAHTVNCVVNDPLGNPVYSFTGPFSGQLDVQP